jgi:NAD(P)-dependent dehydrogenase (short-subunit alcohol dehydrogenase family)
MEEESRDMPQEKKLALVTGANKGIGFELARQLGRNGMTVLLGARNMKLGQEAAHKLKSEGLDAHAVHIDLNQLETIDQAAKQIETDYGRLDVLMNNAGIADPADGPPSTASLQAVRRIFDTNLFGTIAVTQAMLPLVRRAPAGRIVNVSSGLGSLTLNGDPTWEFAQVKRIGYNASKAALNMLTVQLAYELKDTKIKVNSANPGFTATDLNGHRGYQTVEEGAMEALRLALLDENGPTGCLFNRNGPDPW